MDVIRLISGQSTLQICTDTRQLSWVYLIVSGREHYLGLNRKDLILTRIFNSLNNEYDLPIGEIDGSPVSSVVSLSDPHAAIYMGKINDNRCLYFQDAQLQLTGTIILPPPDLKAWIEDLSNYINVSSSIDPP
jgi:hypothetical protein